MSEPTELDLAIVAKENGWSYVPACDEGIAAVDRYMDSQAASLSVKPAPVAAPVRKRTLRTKLIREVMELVKGPEWNFGEDWQSVGFLILNEYAPLVERKTEDETHDYVMGVVRWCEQAVFKGSY